MSPLALLVPAAVAGAAVSGAVGMGGGVLLLAVMATVLAPGVVVPVHGVVQLASNLSRSVVLGRDVCWPVAALYAPTMVLGAWLGLQLYRGAGAAWFKPAIGAFVVATLLWERWKPARLTVPRWVFAPAGIGGGFLTITVGAAGPYLAAFFLRDDLERREIVATKAAIQTFGHFLKIPAFLSIGFDYRAELDVILPLLAAVVAGTWIGTRLLHRMSEGIFRIAFRLVLLALGLRLLASPWF